MKTIKRNVETVAEILICENCGDELRWDRTKTQLPYAKYPHRCVGCGYVELMDETYPKISYRGTIPNKKHRGEYEPWEYRK